MRALAVCFRARYLSSLGLPNTDFLKSEQGRNIFVFIKTGAGNDHGSSGVTDGLTRLMVSLTLNTLGATIVVLNPFFTRLNHCCWERNVCLSINICKYLVSNCANLSNFHPLEVVGRSSEPQLQWVEILII